MPYPRSGGDWSPTVERGIRPDDRGHYGEGPQFPTHQEGKNQFTDMFDRWLESKGLEPLDSEERRQSDELYDRIAPRGDLRQQRMETRQAQLDIDTPPGFTPPLPRARFIRGSQFGFDGDPGYDPPPPQETIDMIDAGVPPRDLPRQPPVFPSGHNRTQDNENLIRKSLGHTLRAMDNPPRNR